MTASNAGVGFDEIARIVAQARAVVDAIDALPGAAPDAADREWAVFRAEEVDAQWRSLQAIMRDGDSQSFGGMIRAIIANFRPLDDAPPAMQPVQLPVQDLIDVLADDFHDVITTKVSADKTYPPELHAALQAILPRLAAEFA